MNNTHFIQAKQTSSAIIMVIIAALFFFVVDTSLSFIVSQVLKLANAG